MFEKNEENVDELISSINKQSISNKPKTVKLDDGSEYSVDENGTWKRLNKRLNKWERKALNKKESK